MEYIEKKVLGVYMPLTLCQRVNNRAHSKQISKSDYIIHLIEKDLKNYETRKKA